MRIIQSTDSIAVEHPIFLIVGQPGICKSTLGYAWNALLFDFDQGSHRVANRGATALLESWADVDTSRRVLEPYAGITIDTVERAIGMLGAAVMEESSKNGANGVLYPQGWGVVKRRFVQFIDGVRAQGKDVLMLAHSKDVRDGDRRVVRADIPGGTYGEVMKRADFVGYLSMRGGRRVLDFSPTDSFIGKNPGAWAPIAVPAADRCHGFVAELFEAGRATLGQMSAESARIAADVGAWQRVIQAYATADEFTRGLEDLRAIKADKPAVYAQAHHLLSQASRAAGMRYSAELSTFVDTGERPPVPASRVILPSASRAATWQPGLLSELTPRERAS